DFKSNKSFHAAALRRDGGVSDAQKRIEHRLNASRACGTMQFDAPFRELNRKRRGMRSLLCPALNCPIGNEPCVAPAAQIASMSMRPAGDITFVLIRNSDGEPIQLNTAGFRKMKNVFVAVVDESLRTNRLEMTEGANSCSRFPMGSAFREQSLAARCV